MVDNLNGWLKNRVTVYACSFTSDLWEKEVPGILEDLVKHWVLDGQFTPEQLETIASEARNQMAKCLVK